MRKLYALLIAFVVLLLVTSTVFANNISNNTINDENEILENEVSNEILDTEETANELENEISEESLIEEEKKEAKSKEEQIIPNGTYRIASATNPFMGLDVESGSKADKANIHIYNYTGVLQAQFKLEYLGDGYYKIINVKSGKLLDVANGGKTKGTNVWQYKDNGTDSQKWKIVETKDGYYNIISKLNDLCLDIDDGHIECASNVQVYTNNGTDAQKFQFLNSDLIKSDSGIQEGTYRISTALKNNSNIDIKDASKSNKANVHLWTYKGLQQQKFKLEYDNGYYVIRNVNSGKVLDVADGSKKSGANVWQYTYNGTDAQKWILKQTEDGYYNIISKLNGLYLDVSNASTNNGANIQVYRANGTNSQKFKLVYKNAPTGKQTIKDGTYRIALAKNEKYGLDISDANKNNKGNVQVWEWDKVEQQEFNVVYLGNGYYNIIAVHSGKVLDVDNGGNTNRTNIWQYENNGSDAQKWVIKDAGNGKYNIISKIDSMYIDVENGTVANGTNIQLYEANGSESQKFKFIEVDSKSEKTIENGNYRIAYGINNKYGLDVSDGSTSNKANVQLWQYTNVRQQKFEVKYIDGYYKIKCIKSNKYLEVDTVNNNVYQNAESDKDVQKWTIRRTSDGHYSLISKYNGLYLDLDKSKVANGTNIKTYKKGNNDAQKYDFIKVAIGIDIDSSKYPGVQEAVDKLAEKYPNWEFEVLYTTLDFDKAVQAEYEYDNKKANLVYTPTYKGDWIAPNPYKEGSWASASFNAIAYFMDPRNFLNDVDIFQFVDLADYELSGATIDSIQYQIEGTYLDGYAKDIQNACKSQDINPYYVLARLIQEQGSKGSITINMDGGDGKKYFNPFNIGVPHGTEEEMKAAALKKAKAEGWDTMQKGLEAGIEFLKDGYIDAKQNTLYLNKFDVNPDSPGSFYTHQYMQNVSAAYSEARIFRGSYEDTNTIANPIKFIIPVYENMPDKPYDKPTGKGDSEDPEPSSDKGPMNVEVFDISTTLKVREGPGTNYKEVERLKNGTVLLSIERLKDGWQRVITPSGKEGYCSGEYLKFIKDVTNCNDKVIVDTTSNIGANVRIGPGTKYEKIKAVPEGSTGIRILKNKYHANDEWWDIVIFDDGTKGFVASSSLKIR